jgi:hypothetical protein
VSEGCSFGCDSLVAWLLVEAGAAVRSGRVGVIGHMKNTIASKTDAAPRYAPMQVSLLGKDHLFHCALDGMRLSISKCGLTIKDEP